MTLISVMEIIPSMLLDQLQFSRHGITVSQFMHNTANIRGWSLDYFNVIMPLSDCGTYMHQSWGITHGLSLYTMNNTMYVDHLLVPKSNLYYSFLSIMLSFDSCGSRYVSLNCLFYLRMDFCRDVQKGYHQLFGLFELNGRRRYWFALFNWKGIQLGHNQQRTAVK